MKQIYLAEIFQKGRTREMMKPFQCNKQKNNVNSLHIAEVVHQ